MDTTPIVARLSIIADRVSALQELAALTLEELEQDRIDDLGDFETFACYVGEYPAGTAPDALK